MAGRSQHPVQIMENQTRFDLNAAIESWRNELAAQPNLASDDRRELETHLRDAIAGFQQRGLNDEESFWLARRRVGQPQQIGEEFVKADPAKAWSERLFWMATGIWGICLLAFVVMPTELFGIAFILSFSSLVGYFVTHLSLIFAAHFLVLAAFFAGGHKLQTLLSWCFQCRLRLIALFVFSTVIACFEMGYCARLGLFGLTPNLADYHQVWEYTWYDSICNWISAAWYMFGEVKFLIIGLLTLLIWLMPAQNRKTPKRA
jgi:uncharacterized membrane protein